jgi:ketosteroid isomerase-like protein
MASKREAQRVVERFMEVFSTGDAAATTALMSDTATWWVAGTTPISGSYSREDFAKLLQSVNDHCTGPIRLTPKAWTIDGERVAVEVQSLTHTHTGRTYNNQYHFLFLVRDGQIAGVREYLDTQHATAVFFTP